MYLLEVRLQCICITRSFFWRYFCEYLREVPKDVVESLFYYQVVTIIIVNHRGQSRYVINLKLIVLTGKHFFDFKSVEHDSDTAICAISTPLTEQSVLYLVRLCVSAERADKCFLIHFFVEGMTVNRAQDIFCYSINLLLNASIFVNISSILFVTLHLFLGDVSNYRAYKLFHFEL